MAWDLELDDAASADASRVAWDLELDDAAAECTHGGAWDLELDDAACMPDDAAGEDALAL